jgi:hypothetical protein
MPGDGAHGRALEDCFWVVWAANPSDLVYRRSDEISSSPVHRPRAELPGLAVHRPTWAEIRPVSCSCVGRRTCAMATREFVLSTRRGRLRSVTNHSGCRTDRYGARLHSPRAIGVRRPHWRTARAGRPCAKAPRRCRLRGGPAGYRQERGRACSGGSPGPYRPSWAKRD